MSGKVDQEKGLLMVGWEIFHTSYGTCRITAIKLCVCSMITIATVANTAEVVAAQEPNPRRQLLRYYCKSISGNLLVPDLPWG
jgi:hypothetical protein